MNRESLPFLPCLYADTSKIAEIQPLYDLGIIKGITTNPLIVAKEAGTEKPEGYYQRIRQAFPDLPVSIQLLDGDTNELVNQARRYSTLGEFVYKVPAYSDGRGLVVARQLTRERHQINATALMSAEQALTIFLAIGGEGPRYVSLFFNRIKDSGGNPEEEITKTRALIDKFGLRTNIISGSIRSQEDVYRSILAGSHIVTVSAKIIWQMIGHPKSDEFIKQGLAAWSEYLQKQTP